MRLFVAIRFSPAVRAVLLDAMDALRRQGQGTFTRPENLHLTLAFLGEVEDPAPVREALAAACTGGAFSLTVGGLGRFEDLWWAGVRDNERLRPWPSGCKTPCGRRAFPSNGGPGGPTSPWSAAGGGRGPA